MATIIEFYVPSGFRKKATKWIPPEQHGKIIQFGSSAMRRFQRDHSLSGENRVTGLKCAQPRNLTSARPSNF
jgi:hypothetical protein